MPRLERGRHVTEGWSTTTLANRHPKAQRHGSRRSFRGSDQYHPPECVGAAVDAAFAHVITIRGDRIAALRQIADTARWGFPW
jgi:hypothetical protein